MATVILQGILFKSYGRLLCIRSKAPDFRLAAADLADKSLADFAGKKLLLNIVPSLDTPVCATSTKKFDDLIGGHNDAVVLIVSADLPFAQDRFCQAENTPRVTTLSMMRSRNFAKDYGVLMTDGPLAGITARAVVVLDQDNKVVYTELVPEIADEPNYDAAMAAL